MHIFHSWSAWSELEPYRYLATDRRGNPIRPYTTLIGYYQSKTCRKCGKVKEREVS